MVGSCPLCGLGLTIFDTACFDSPTACAMSFCQSSTFINIFYSSPAQVLGFLRFRQFSIFSYFARGEVISLQLRLRVNAEESQTR